MLERRDAEASPGNARACESMVKKAVQAASARDDSSLSTIGIQISDIDAEFGDTDPLTLLERLKVCVLFSACIFVAIK